jgi:hypothetical protein
MSSHAMLTRAPPFNKGRVHHSRCWQKAFESVVVRRAVFCDVSLSLLVAVVVESVPSGVMIVPCDDEQQMMS